MNTRLLMSFSALLLGITGVTLTFLPAEVLTVMPGNFAGNTLLLQILGSLYFAFAMLNWMARGNLIGGIYSRPVAIANLTHFFIAAIALLKAAGSTTSITIWIGAGVYIILAVLFGIVVYTNPVKAAI